jgi:hypothetical protein
MAATDVVEEEQHRKQQAASFPQQSTGRSWRCDAILSSLAIAPGFVLATQEWVRNR